MSDKEKQPETHTFEGGLQRDMALWVIPNNCYYDALNIRIFQSGQRFIITNPLGNVEVPFQLPEGENYCLGSYGDTENNKFYWFNWNENDFHGVYMYNYILNNVTPILINLTDTDNIDILKFKKRSLILMIDVIKGHNGQDLIYWVDGQTNQKKLNVQKALDKSTAGFGVTITANDINAYKLAAGAPRTGYFTDITRDTNFVYGHLYKASLRQWFDDGEKNNWSEFSTVALPINTGASSGNPAVTNVNNTLQITVETGPRTVKQLEIALKDGTKNFVSIVVLDKAKLGIPDNSTYVYNFYNDSTNYAGLVQEKVYRAYSFMPRLAALQAFCHNAMVYGKGIEGFPIVDVKLSSEVLYSDLFIASDVENQLNEPFFEAVMETYDYTKKGSGRRRNSLIRVTVGHDVKAGNKFELSGRNGDGDNPYFAYTAVNADSSITVADNFKQQLVASGRIINDSEDIPYTNIWDNSVDVQGNVTFKFIWYGSYDDNATSFSGQVSPVTFQTLKNGGQSVATQKSGDSVNYAILYWNEHTYRSNAYTSPGGFVRNDFVTQTGGFKKIDHRISIHNQPPEWATHYEIVRTSGLTYGELPDSYIHVLIQKAIESQSTTDTDYVDLVIGSLYTYQKMYPNTILRYEFAKNDRVRLIKKQETDEYYPFIETVVLDFKEVGATTDIFEDVTTNNTNTITIGGITSSDNVGRFIVIDGIERQIIAAPSGNTYTLGSPFGTAQKYAGFQIVDKRGMIRVRKPIGITIEDNSLIEVYKPSENTETERKNFFLFGQKYVIQNAGTDLRSHTGSIQNQDPANPDGTPAIVSITEGTSYVRNRQLPTNNAVPGTQALIGLVEDNSYSDFFESHINNNGKTAPEDDGSGEIRFGSRLRYSNNYIEGTRINGLNDFDNLDRKDYNDPWGDFMLLKYRDRLLYAFKQLRVGYIGVLNSIITTSDGDPSLATSTEFLNQYQTFSWEGGIGNNPESYSSEQNWQWFLSPNSGTDCRIGGDGILPTSHQFGLSKTVREYIDAAQKYGSFIFGGFDRENSERILAFEPYKPYVFRGAFTETDWKLYNDPLPEDTNYEITTQPVNGADSVPVEGVTTYTPDTDYVGSDPSFFRWNTGSGWSNPKKICLSVIDDPVPPLPTTYYNDLYTEDFTKSNCAPGYHGSVVEYEVPALKYSSPFDQDSADAQAEEEALQFGQANADDLGTCALNVPFAYAFTDLTGLNLSTLTESGAQIIDGDYDDYIIVVAAGTEYQVDGGDWTAADGVIPNGASVKLRKTTSGSYVTPVSGSVTIGGVTDTWTITTKVAPTLSIAYSNDDDDPVGYTRLFVDGNLFVYVNGVLTATMMGTGSSTFNAPAGATINVKYESEPARFPWPPQSSATLNVTNGATQIHTDTDSTQAEEIFDYTFVASDEDGTYEIEAFTASVVAGYENNNFSVEVLAEVPIDSIEMELVDTTNSTWVLRCANVANGSTGSYGYNCTNNADTLSLEVTNTSTEDIAFNLTGAGYDQTQTILAGQSYTFTGVPKTVLEGIITDSIAVACGASSAYAGGEAFPTEETVILGTATGTVTLTFNANSVPDKFEVWFEGVKVIDTGYRGSTSEQAALDAELASRSLPPETITAPGNGTASFVKSTATSTAIVKVYAPMSGTAWDYTLGCPVP